MSEQIKPDTPGPQKLTPWFVREPNSLQEIREYLRRRFPNLHAFEEISSVEITGTFPVVGPKGLLDEYQVSIVLKANYPISLPIVYETAGKIPRIPERHIFDDGSACVFHPDDRWRCFPEGAQFHQYIEGPLYNFFLSQTLFEETGEWPFGELDHGAKGTKQYYSDLFGTRNLETVSLFLRELSEEKISPHRICPCGSGRTTGECCLSKLEALHGKLPRSQAQRRAADFEQWHLADSKSVLAESNPWPLTPIVSELIEDGADKLITAGRLSAAQWIKHSDHPALRRLTQEERELIGDCIATGGTEFLITTKTETR